MSSFDFGQSVENGLTKAFEYLPQVLGAVFLLVIGYFVAKLVQRVTRRALVKLRFDHAVTSSLAGNSVNRLIDRPSRFVSKGAFWMVWIAFLSFGVSALNVPAITLFVAGLYSYVPDVIAAIAIFLVASAISAGSARFIRRVLGNSPMASVLRTVAPSVTMSIAVFMILNQLGIAKDIVNITYIAIMGSLSLGLALSFGLGGRDLASKILEDAYDAGKNKLSISDLKSATRAAKSESRAAVNKIR